MAVIELLYKIEESFNLQIPDQDLTGLTTVGAVAGYVESRLAPATNAASVQSKKIAIKSKNKITSKKKK
jgi:acyl carrier protein